MSTKYVIALGFGSIMTAVAKARRSSWTTSRMRSKQCMEHVKPCRSPGCETVDILEAFGIQGSLWFFLWGWPGLPTLWYRAAPHQWALVGASKLCLEAESSILKGHPRTSQNQHEVNRIQQMMYIESYRYQYGTSYYLFLCKKCTIVK